MNEAKIQLSEDEYQLLQNADWILTKNAIIRKVSDFFGALAAEMNQAWEGHRFPEELGRTRAKISKGENYKGLPYVVLDYPREFKKEDIFAIRTLFWWGNYFSITLHLKGMYKKNFEENIYRHREILGSHGFHLSIAEEEWSHELNEEQYLPLNQTVNKKMEMVLAEKTFLKLSAKIDFHQWNEAGSWLLNQFSILLQSMEA